MKRRSLIGGGVAGAAALAGAGMAWWRLRVEEPPLPAGFWDSRFERPEGGELTLASLRGKPMVLNFWATWCAPCRQELPVLDAFQRKYAGQGVDVVAVSVDERGDLDAVRRVLAPFSFAGALAVDSDLRAFGRVRQVPATFVVDRHGVLRRNGWDEAGIVDADALDRAVRPLLRSGG